MPDFPYINARVRAMRSRLLPSARLEELLGTPTMEAFLQGLATRSEERRVGKECRL